MSTQSHISLIDLSQQLPFEIDDELKREICFAETLLISCAHYEGDTVGGDEGPEGRAWPGGPQATDSELSCYETEESEISEEMKKDQDMIEVIDHVEPEVEDEEPEDNDFQFYFFPECSKPVLPKDSRASIVTVNGLPQINPISEGKRQNFCLCKKDRKGKCTCNAKLRCYCGAKMAYECTCAQLENICICHEGKPNVICTCKNCKICVCHPDNIPRPICTCDKVEKPCICKKGKFPSPVCTCKHKTCICELEKGVIPDCMCKDKKHDEISVLEEIESENEEEFGEEIETEKEIVEADVQEEQEPCECQKPDPKPPCLCKKGNDCICNKNACICGVQKSCVCEPTESQKEIECKDEDAKSICSCPIPKECTCNAIATNDCTCFPKEPVCTCRSPDSCKCFAVCDCTNPCICDTLPNEEKECICLDKSKQVKEGAICTCPCKEDDGKKLKKVRAGKHGYRWCHDVDPRHTFFDYGYDRHDKISYKEQEKEKFKILGIYDEKEEDVCAIHGLKAPPFIKKVRKPSLDCCSTVGGISISVETLGEDKDKFLVQVVSHSSKEGAKTGSKLVSILDCNLHTLEENRVEHITKNELTKERRSYMAICDSGYYNKVTKICGERHVVKRFYLSFDDARNFLLEGANVVLLRYFGLRRYRGTIKTETVLMDGTICESTYVCPGVSQGIVNGTPLFVVKVERHIIEPSGMLHQSLTVLTLRGYIISHEWADNSYIIHLNPLLRINPEKDRIEPHAPLRETWRQDLQLLSDFLDFKSTRSSEGGRYVAESGALTATVRDYLQAVLMLRPHDALHFTRHYFASALSAMDLPHDEYFDPCPKHVRYFFFED